MALHEWHCLLSCLFIPGAVLGIVGMAGGFRAVRFPSAMLLSAAFLVLLGIGLRQMLLLRHHETVVIAEEAFAYSTPDEGEDKVFRLGEGGVVLLAERNREDWIEVRLYDGTRGWMRRDDVLPITEGNDI